MNHFFTLLLAASCLTAVGQVPEYVPTDGLLSYFSFSGSFDELAGSNLHLEADGEISFDEDHFGQVAEAARFNSQSSLVLVSDICVVTNSMSVSAWINAESTGQSRIFTQFYGSGQEILPQQYSMLLASDSEGVRPYFLGSGTQGSMEPNGPNVGPVISDLGEWFHLSMVYDGSDLIFYANGEVVYEQLIGYGFASATPNPFVKLGQRNDGEEQFVGRIDELIIHDRALSHDEVVAIFYAQLIPGCTDPESCNFDSSATADDGSCEYAPENYDCEGNCTAGFDCNGVCGGSSVEDDCGVCGGDGTSGCTNSYACNFDAEAACDDGSCDYSCCPGPGCCGEGMFWDWNLGECAITNPTDSNFDGCVQLNDLLDLLSAYGNCSSEESPWQCGDPLGYQGYDYETVQIGEQCWFAENVRAMELNDGTLISQGVVSQTPGLSYYNNDPSLGSIVGLHYNYWAALDVCPNDWHLPTDVEFNELMSFLNQQYPGAQVSGLVLKASEDAVLSWNGTNSTGFTGLPGGFISQNGMSYQYGADGGWWWTRNTLEAPDVGHGFSLNTYNDMPVSVGYTQGDQGRSIRCIKDSE